MSARMPGLVPAFVGLATSLAAGQALALPRLISSPVEKVFVPLGFDDNDVVEIVVHGHFPNTCYRTGEATATVDEDAQTVTVEATSYLYDGVRCADMLLPFTQTVRLGLVKAGTYTVEVVDHPLAYAPPLAIANAASDAPDDHLYAPVASVALDVSAAGVRAVRIAGEYPLMLVGCMMISDVRTWMSPGGTLVVLPIATLEDDATCAARGAKRTFDVTAPVAAAMPAGEYLIHVRSLNGTSLNRFIDLSN